MEMRGPIRRKPRHIFIYVPMKENRWIGDEVGGWIHDGDDYSRWMHNKERYETKQEKAEKKL